MAEAVGEGLGLHRGGSRRKDSACAPEAPGDTWGHLHGGTAEFRGSCAPALLGWLDLPSPKPQAGAVPSLSLSSALSVTSGEKQTQGHGFPHSHLSTALSYSTCLRLSLFLPPSPETRVL